MKKQIMPFSVTKAWVMTLPFRMQSVLMAAIRGCDITKKEDPSKAVARALRALLLNNADSSNSFIVGDGTPNKQSVVSFLGDLDAYPVHFIGHLMHAAEIVGYKHPEAKISFWWQEFYAKLVAALHLNPETEEQLDVRLGTTPEELSVRGLVPEEPQRWSAGTGTSHEKAGYG